MNYQQRRKQMKNKYDAIAKAAVPSNFDDVVYETFEKFSEGEADGTQSDSQTKESDWKISL